MIARASGPVGGASLPAPITIKSKHKSGPRSVSARGSRQECRSHKIAAGRRSHRRQRAVEA